MTPELQTAVTNLVECINDLIDVRAEHTTWGDQQCSIEEQDKLGEAIVLLIVAAKGCKP